MNKYLHPWFDTHLKEIKETAVLLAMPPDVAQRQYLVCIRPIYMQQGAFLTRYLSHSGYMTNYDGLNL